jgi:uncharacterized cupin superfamily protein
MKNKGIIITNKENITPKHKFEYGSFEYVKYEITERGANNQCYVCLYEIPPQKAAYPYHTANTAVFYIISGSGVMETPDGVKNIAAGDVIVCPPNDKGAHKMINTSETDILTYLDCDTTNSPDVVFYPASGKIGTLIHGESSIFFEKSSAVDYYKGEQ